MFNNIKLLKEKNTYLRPNSFDDNNEKNIACLKLKKLKLLNKIK